MKISPIRTSHVISKSVSGNSGSALSGRSRRAKAFLDSAGFAGTLSGAGSTNDTDKANSVRAAQSDQVAGIAAVSLAISAGVASRPGFRVRWPVLVSDAVTPSNSQLFELTRAIYTATMPTRAFGQ
jgi:hypothetical protein